MQGRGEELKIYSKSTQKHSPHINSQDFTWQKCQAKEEAPHLGASLSTTKVFLSKSKWLKPYG